MADYFGNVLIEPQTVEHEAVFFTLAVELIRQAQQANDIQDTIVVVEPTGNYHLPRNSSRSHTRANLEDQPRLSESSPTVWSEQLWNQP